MSRTTGGDPWRSVPDQLRARGQRWTPQRRAIIEVLANTEGHISGAEVVERCRAIDPATVPSTVYRTLDVLEELGFVRHGHDAQGREEYHVRPESAHGHLYCDSCGGIWEITGEEEIAVAGAFAGRGFEVDVSHVTVVGRCEGCRGRGAATRGQ